VPGFGLGGFGEAVDHLAQNVQGFVYAAALFQALAVYLLGALGAGQVDEVEVTDFCVDHPILGVFRLDLHRENRVTSRTSLIIARRPHMPPLGPLLQYIKRLILFKNSLLRDPLHIDPLLDILPDLQVAVILGIQEINDLFVVDLQERAPDDILGLGFPDLHVD